MRRRARRRTLRRRFAHARGRYTWTVAWTLGGPNNEVEKALEEYGRGGKAPNMQSFRSPKKANEHALYLINRGYSAVAFKWWHDEPHFRGLKA